MPLTPPTPKDVLHGRTVEPYENKLSSFGSFTKSIIIKVRDGRLVKLSKCLFKIYVKIAIQFPSQWYNEDERLVRHPVERHGKIMFAKSLISVHDGSVYSSGKPHFNKIYF